MLEAIMYALLAVLTALDEVIYQLQTLMFSLFEGGITFEEAGHRLADQLEQLASVADAIARVIGENLIR